MKTATTVNSTDMFERVAGSRSRAHHGSKTFVLALLAALAMPLVSCRPSYPTSPSRDAEASVAAAPAAGEISIVPQAEVFAGACDIQPSIDAFRAALGTLNPNVPGSFGSGRREINWDAVPAAFTNTNNFPADFFNQPVTGRARGALFSTGGAGFRVSDNNFADLNPSYGAEFEFFSPVRTFIAVGDPASSVEFFVPGTAIRATTTGFGVVFSDVDHLGSARLRLFDAAGLPLGTYLAPACPGGLSFLGVRFPEPVVAKVEVVSGFAALGAESFDLGGSQGRVQDLVIMDDFLYGEPIQGETLTAIGTDAKFNP